MRQAGDGIAIAEAGVGKAIAAERISRAVGFRGIIGRDRHNGLRTGKDQVRGIHVVITILHCFIYSRTFILSRSYLFVIIRLRFRRT